MRLDVTIANLTIAGMEIEQSIIEQCMAILQTGELL